MSQKYFNRLKLVQFVIFEKIFCVVYKKWTKSYFGPIG